MPSFCLICYRVANKNGPSDDHRIFTEKLPNCWEEQQRFFRLLERYLYYYWDLEGARRKQYRFPFPVEQLAENGMLSCSDCLQLMESFCQLYHELKTIELRLNWTVQKFSNIMRCSQRVPSRVKLLHEFVGTREINGIEVGVYGNNLMDFIITSKKSLIANCSRKETNVLPKLSIVKWKPRKDPEDHGNVTSDKMTISGKCHQYQDDVGDSAQISDAGCNLEMDQTEHLSSSPIAENETLFEIDEPGIMEHEDSLKSVHPIKTEADRENKETMETESCQEIPLEHNDNGHVNELTSEKPEEEMPASQVPQSHPNNAPSDKVTVSEQEPQTETVGIEFHRNLEMDHVQPPVYYPAIHEQENIFESDEPVEAVSVSTGGQEGKLTSLELIKADVDQETEEIAEDNSNILECHDSANLITLDIANSEEDITVVSQDENNGSPKSPKQGFSLLRPTQRCPSCGKTFSSLERLNSHITELHPQASYNDNDNGGDDESSTENGSDRQDNDSSSSSSSGHVGLRITSPVPSICRLRPRPAHNCPKCPITFPTVGKLLEHQQSHHKEEQESSPTNHDKIAENDSDEHDNSKTHSDGNASDSDSASSCLELESYTRKQRIRCKVANCKSIFYNEDDYKNHQKFHELLSCNFCDSVQFPAVDLPWHEITKHSSDPAILKGPHPVYACPRQICSYSSGNKKNYIRHHLQEHLNLNPNQLNHTSTCEICGIIYTSAAYLHGPKVLLRRHHDEAHNLKNLKEGDTPLKCDQEGCQAYFLRPGQLSLHKRDVHDIKECFTCSECNAGFKTSDQVRIHKEKHHAETLTYLCTISGCTHRAESKTGLAAHIRLAHRKLPTEPFGCTECERTFWGKPGLKAHMRTHSTNRLKHICEHCGKSFKDAYKLNRHRLSHSGPDSWQFLCSVCSKKCSTKQSLEVHMRTHGREKPFVCEVCGTKYAKADTLRKHLRSKHGDDAKDIQGTKNKTNLTSSKTIKRKRGPE